jgi:hypothetical protein
MPSFKINAFGGLAPRGHKALGDGARATVAENVKLWHGSLEPWRAPREILASPDVACIKTMHRYECCWVAMGDACADIAESFKDCPRFFATGHAPYPYPIVGDVPDCGNDKLCAVQWKRLGLPKPLFPLTFTAPEIVVPNNRPVKGEQLKRETRNYIYTYVNCNGDEGAPSDPAHLGIDVDVDADANLLIPPIPATGGWDICSVRIYRIGTGLDVTGDGSAVMGQTTGFMAEYFFVGEIDVSTATPGLTQFSFLDDVPLSEVGEMNTTRHFLPPPEGLSNITAMGNSLTLAGSVGNKIYFTDPGHYHAWSCSISLDDNVEALVYSAGTLYALTDGHPYAIAERGAEVEDDCRCCRDVFRYSEPLPCISKRSAANTSTGVIWASRDGLARMTGREAQIFTHATLAEDDWAKLLPHTMTGIVHDGRYFGFTDAQGFIFDFVDGVYADGDVGANSNYTTLTLTPNALFRTRDDFLYMAFGNTIAKWDDGNTYMDYRWRTKLQSTESVTNLGVARLIFDKWDRPADAGSSVNIKFIGDGRLKYEREVNHSKPFRLPHGRHYLNFEVELSGREPIRELRIAGNVDELTSST